MYALRVYTQTHRPSPDTGAGPLCINMNQALQT